MKKYLLLTLSVFLFGCSTTPESNNTHDSTPEPISTDKSGSEDVVKIDEEIKTDDKAVAERPKESQPVIKPTKSVKTSDGKLILGEQEWVYIKGLNINVKARIDTGATTSSVSATDIEKFERDGKDWIKFKLAHNEQSSREYSLPVERWVKIKQSSNVNKLQERAVIVAWVQVGDVKVHTEFTLTDRTHLNFGMLMGRSFFRDIAVVDVSKKYVQPKVAIK